MNINDNDNEDGDGREISYIVDHVIIKMQSNKNLGVT